MSEEMSHAELREELLSMRNFGAIAVVGWQDGEPTFLNTAYGVRGFRFDWAEATQIALIGKLVQTLHVPGCDHDPSLLSSKPGIVECRNGCGSTWELILTPTPDPHEL